MTGEQRLRIRTPPPEKGSRDRPAGKPREDGSLARGVIVRFLALGAGFTRTLLFLPVISRVYGPLDYGIWSQTMITLDLLAPVLMLRLENAAARFLSSLSTPRREQEFVGMLVLIWAVLAAFSAVLLVAGDFVAGVLFGGKEYSTYVAPLALLLCSRVTWVFLLSYFRARQRHGLYTLLEVATLTGGIGVALGFALTGTELRIVMISMALVELGASCAVLGGLWICARTILRPRFAPVMRYLRYSVPLIPNRLASWVIQSSDRLVILHFLGLGAVARYAAAYTLGKMLMMLVQPIGFVLLPRLAGMWDRGNRGGATRTMESALRYFLIVSFPAVLGLTHLARRILGLLSGGTLVPSEWVVLFVAVGILLGATSRFFTMVMQLAQRTGRLPLIIGAAAAVNLLLNLLLVPHIGILAAAISTFVAYLLQLAALVWYTRGVAALRLGLAAFVKIAVASAVMFAVLFLIQWPGVLGLALEIGCGILAYLATLLAVRGIDPSDMDRLKRLFRSS